MKREQRARKNKTPQRNDHFMLGFDIIPNEEFRYHRELVDPVKIRDSFNATEKVSFPYFICKFAV